MAWPWPPQVLPIHGGRDSGRLDFSVRTWPAEAATAADQTGGLGGGAPQQKPDLTLTCMKGHVLGSALSHDPGCPDFPHLNALRSRRYCCTLGLLQKQRPSH